MARPFAPRVLRGALFFITLLLLSCKDDIGEVGFRNPNRDFEVFAKEFTIPTSVIQIDSLATTNGSGTASPQRVLCGISNDPVFGKTTAINYMQYYALGRPDTLDVNAVFEKLTLTMIFDYYWEGNTSPSTQTYQFYEVADSILTYAPRYSNQSQPLGKYLGQVDRLVSPGDFDQSVKDNSDTDNTNNIIDSLNIDLDQDLGRRLLAAAMDTVGLNEQDYSFFYKFRRIFKGLAMVPLNADKIVGFNPEHAKFRMTLHYKKGTRSKQLVYKFNPSGQSAVNIGEYPTYTELRVDRSGTALAGLATKYVDFLPADGKRYVQSGTGVLVKLDFTPVYDFFKTIPTKAFSVAELRIETDEQTKAPTKFLLRALKANNRYRFATKSDVDKAGDPTTILDTDFTSKHALYANSLTRIEPVSDEGGLFTLNQSSNESGKAVYTGYLTNFLQAETALTDADFLRYFAMIPQTPDVSKSLNGFYFPADNIKLKIYYTTPGLKE